MYDISLVGRPGFSYDNIDLFLPQFILCCAIVHSFSISKNASPFLKSFVRLLSLFFVIAV